MKKLIRKKYREIRMSILRKKYNLKNVHETFYLGGKSIIACDFIAGPYSYVGPNCKIYPKVSIGAFTMLANNVSIIGGDHCYDKPGIPIIFSGRQEIKETIIGKDVWIGAFSQINVGVKIGDGAIIAMGSVVTKDVDSYSIYGGVPATKIKPRFNSSSHIAEHKSMLGKTISENGFGFDMLCK